MAGHGHGVRDRRNSASCGSAGCQEKVETPHFDMTCCLLTMALSTMAASALLGRVGERRAAVVRRGGRASLEWLVGRLTPR